MQQFNKSWTKDQWVQVEGLLKEDLIGDTLVHRQADWLVLQFAESTALRVQIWVRHHEKDTSVFKSQTCPTADTDVLFVLPLGCSAGLLCQLGSC